MHDITNVKVKNPIILVLHTEDRLYVILELHVANFVLLKRSLTLFLALINIVVSRLLSAQLAHLKHLLRCLLISNASSAFNFAIRGLHWA